jgi:hypothetical protein
MIAALVFPSSALADQVSQDMTCAEAVAHYEKNRRIMTINE